jgi:hypothetical protein
VSLYPVSGLSPEFLHRIAVGAFRSFNALCARLTPWCGVIGKTSPLRDDQMLRFGSRFPVSGEHIELIPVDKMYFMFAAVDA